MGQEPLNRTEYYKYSSEYLKHLSTLSTGAILWITTFLEKLSKTPAGKPMLAIALFAFMVSILSIVRNYTLHLRTFPGIKDEISESEKIQSGRAIFFAWLGFIIGVIVLSAFGMINLLH
jgi:hypothetical protein